MKSQPPLYRRIAAVATCALIFVGAIAYAQLSRSHSLRAIALVELYGPATKPTGGRLIPIVILTSDKFHEIKFYDAATYDATPRPLALDPGTVYEALNNGEPAGFFTVAAAKQEKGEWFGLGQWKSAADAERAEKAAAARRERTRTLDDEGPPKLRKSGSSEKKSGDSASSSRPKLGDRTKPDTSKPSTAKPDAPKTGSPQTARARGPIAPPDRVPIDPDRPTLRRGGGSQVSATLDAPPTPAPPKPGELRKRDDAKSGGPSQVFIAVSDPDGTGTTRPFTFPWKPEEERALKAKAIALAETEVEKYRAGRSSATPPTSKTKTRKKVQAPATHLTNVTVTGYDLNLDNNAEMVVTGSIGDTYVTLVARTDLEFTPQKVFAVVTDRDHLDAIPRMELIGPIDADAKGKSELLFRVIGDGSYRYALYRVTRDTMTELWKSGLYEQ